jgi:glutamyl/glutaminyl-tRNA synthetase
MHRISELPKLGIYFFERPQTDKHSSLLSVLWDEKKSHTLLEQVLQELQNLKENEWSSQDIQTLLKSISKKNQVSISAIFHPLRFVLTSSQIGAGIPQTIEILGKPETLFRIKCGLEILR